MSRNEILASPLCRAIFSGEAAAKLHEGTAKIVRDRSGLPLAIARGDVGRFVGQARLVPVGGTESAGTALLGRAGDILGGFCGIGNLILNGINTWQLGKLRGEVAATRAVVKAEARQIRNAIAESTAVLGEHITIENEATRAAVHIEGHQTRGVVVAAAAALGAHVSVEGAATRAAVQIEGHQNRNVVVAGTAVLGEHVTTENEATRAAVQIEGRVIRDLLVQGIGELSTQLANSTADFASMIGANSDLTKKGFRAVLLKLDAIQSEQRDGFLRVEDRLDQATRQIKAHELVKAIFGLQAVEKVLGSLDHYSDPTDELRHSARRLEQELLPIFKTHLSTSDGIARIPAGLLLAQGSMILGLLRLALDEQKLAVAAFRDVEMGARGMVKELMQPGGTPFEFFQTRLPTAHLFVGISHVARNASLSLRPEDAEPADVVASDGPSAHTNDDSLPAATQLQLPTNLGQSRGKRECYNRTERPARLVSRIFQAVVPSTSTWNIPFDDLKSVVGVPSNMYPAKGLTEKEANAVGPVLEAMADPATREVERFLVLAACGIEPMTASRRQELAAEIAKLLEDALDLEISSAELASMSDRSMLSVKAALLSSEGGQSVQNQCSRVLSKEEQQARVQRDEAQRSTARLQTQLDQVRRDLEAQPDAQHRLATQLTDELVALLPLEKKIQGLLVQQKLPFRWLRQR